MSFDDVFADVSMEDFKKKQDVEGKNTEGLDDYKTMLESVKTQLSESGFEDLTADDIVKLSERLGVSSDEIQKLVDSAGTPDIRHTNGSTVSFGQYCTFAGCQGTCRGCAGRH